MADVYLSARQVARRYNLSIRTIRRWHATGKLRGVYVSHLWRISQAEIESHIRSQRPVITFSSSSK